MRLRALVLACAAGLLLSAASGLATAKPAKEIVWRTDVKAAFEEAAKEGKVLMICINARDTEGEPMEPAAQGLRDVVYKDPKIVVKSQAFVCVFLTPEGSSDDYGELRHQFGIDGRIISPQHIFAHPKHKPGDKPLVRKQFWPYGKGKTAVKALLDLMDHALTAFRVKEGMPDAPPPAEPPEQTGEGPAPASDAGAADRKAWIDKMLELVRKGEHAARLEALRALVEHDQKGDCTGALIPLIAEFDKANNALAVGDLVRALGIPGLVAAADAIHTVLGHKDDRVRGHAAVSLEYIGSIDSVEPLVARVKREKNEKIANHLYRALGRCGATNDKVKKRLLGKAIPKKADFPHYGPAIGLAYFEGDAKLARSLEKQILKLGDAFMGDQYGKHTLLRGLLVWCLSEIRDPQSSPWIRKRLIEPLSDEKTAWGKGHIMGFYDAVARKCAGQADTQETIDKGVLGLLWYERGGELLDEYRLGRSVARFAPKGEFGRKPEEEEQK